MFYKIDWQVYFCNNYEITKKFRIYVMSHPRNDSNGFLVRFAANGWQLQKTSEVNNHCITRNLLSFLIYECLLFGNLSARPSKRLMIKFYVVIHRLLGCILCIFYVDRCWNVFTFAVRHVVNKCCKEGRLITETSPYCTRRYAEHSELHPFSINKIARAKCAIG